MSLLFSIVFAQQLTVATIPGLSAIPQEKISETIQEANVYFSEMGFRFRYQTLSIDSVPAECMSADYGTRDTQLKCLRGLVTPKRKKLFFFFTGPWQNGTSLAYGGRAEGFCAHVAMGTFNEYSIPYTGMLVAHEVAHLMCATHDAGDPNLMSPVIGFPKPGAIAAVTEMTKRQVRRWYVKNRG